MEALARQTKILFADLGSDHKNLAFTDTAKADSKQSAGKPVRLSSSLILHCQRIRRLMCFPTSLKTLEGTLSKAYHFPESH